MSRIDFAQAARDAQLFVDGQWTAVTATINKNALGRLNRFRKKNQFKELLAAGGREKFVNLLVREAIGSVYSPMLKKEYAAKVKSAHGNPILLKEINNRYANEYGAFVQQAVPLYMKKIGGIVTLPFDLKDKVEKLMGALAMAGKLLGESEAGDHRTNRGNGDTLGESGWDIALRRAAGAATPSPQHASEARKRIRAAAAPAFAAALDRGVDAALLTRFAARHPGGVDAGKLRAAFAEAANRAFAAEFVRLVGGRPPASAEDLALGAVIAVTIAQTTGRFPIVPPAAVAPMAVLVHRALRPQLPQLARMAAVIAAAPAAPRPTAPAREMAW